MSGATKGGGVLDRHELSSSPLSSALTTTAAGDDLDLVGRGADIGVLNWLLLAEEASSGSCVNGALDTEAAISAAN